MTHNASFRDCRRVPVKLYAVRVLETQCTIHTYIHTHIGLAEPFVCEAGVRCNLRAELVNVARFRPEPA